MLHPILPENPFVRWPSRLAAILLMSLGVAGAHERENQSPVNHPLQGEAGAMTLRTGWDTRYATEGRDALDGDSLWRTSFEWDQGPLAWGAWYGNSPDQRYDELQLSVAWRQSWGELDGYLGYTHYRFPHNGAHDHEFGIGVAHGGMPLGIELALDAYHSMEADGFFVETTASREWELSEKWSANASAVFGINQGYVADGHDGANHVDLVMGLSYALSESLSLNFHGAHNWAIDREAGAAGDASLKDFFHAGVGLEWSF